MVPYLVVKKLNKDFESSGENFEVFKDLNFEESFIYNALMENE